jgi:2-polyprenyl-6-hydroxyphenyl methylase/3-demethylubiquinone-9 3-methyltransferase
MTDWTPQGLFRRLLATQMRCTKAIDSLLPERWTKDGNEDFLRDIVVRQVGHGSRICDVGAGRSPCLSAQRKQELGATICGLDVDPAELAAAAPGIYDEVVCADISGYPGREDFDVVVCQSLLEHVRDTGAALAGIASLIKPGGSALLFVPSRRAVFARLNRLLPQALKRRILHGVFPESQGRQGFPAYYDRCTPREFSKMVRAVGLQVEASRYYYSSGYFRFLVPLHVLWRIWSLSAAALWKEQAAETFVLVLRKPAPERA